VDDREAMQVATDGGSHTPLVRSVERAGQVLEALLAAPRGLRLTELSEEVGLHKTTVLRLLRTLVAIRAVRRSEADDRYHWDPVRWLLVARNLHDTASRLDLIRGLLHELANATGQTALLATPDGRQRNMLLVATAAPRSSLRVDLQGRVSAPLHAVADGKLYLSTLPAASLDEYLNQDLVALTPQTLTAGDALRAHLARIRQQGYSTTRQEFLPNAAALSVPVWDEQRAMVAGLNVVGPLDQYTEANLAQWLPQMQVIAKQLSQILYPWRDAGGEPTDEGTISTGEAISQSETRFRKTYRIP
jgi:DNA-binding IclR family transcriptional regulator